jgi:predicted transcriptional regulator
MNYAKQMGFLDIDNEPLKLPNVLLSLRSEWYQVILDGVKKYEYRRKFLKQPSIAFIYVSGTTRAICAKINFGQPIIASIDELIRIRDAEQRPGGGDGMRAYMQGLKEGFAIPILSCQKIKPTSLDELRCRFPGFTVPQSYILLDKKTELLDFLLSQPIISEKETQ